MFTVSDDCWIDHWLIRSKLSIKLKKNISDQKKQIHPALMKQPPGRDFRPLLRKAFNRNILMTSKSIRACSSPPSSITAKPLLGTSPGRIKTGLLKRYRDRTTHLQEKESLPCLAEWNHLQGKKNITHQRQSRHTEPGEGAQEALETQRLFQCYQGYVWLELD